MSRRRLFRGRKPDDCLHEVKLPTEAELRCPVTIISRDRPLGKEEREGVQHRVVTCLW